MDAFILDSHVHFWDRSIHDHPWLDGAADKLGDPDKPQLPDAVLPTDLDLAHGGVAGVIFVEADVAPHQRVSEARWVDGLRDEWPQLVGIVASAPIEDARALAATLDQYADLPSVVGIRRLLQSENEAFVRSPALAAGLRMVGQAGLTFDVCVRFEQLDAVDDLVGAAPDTRVVVDHLGKPPVARGVASDEGRRWRASLARLARRENVTIKLSGLAPESDFGRPLGDQALPFLMAALDLFGAARSMVGSDWPVSMATSQAVGYAEWFRLVLDGAGLSGAEIDDVSHAAASRFYGVPSIPALANIMPTRSTARESVHRADS